MCDSKLNIRRDLKLDTSKEELKAIDEHFKSIYEMEFEKFKELLEVMVRLGLFECQDFEVLIDDFERWKSAKMALKSLKNGNCQIIARDLW